MRVISERALRDFIEKHPKARVPVYEWLQKARGAEWGCFADIKDTFNSVDSVGNKRYVFNVGGNKYRIVGLVRFIPEQIFVRFAVTHKEYDKIDCKNI